MKDIDIIRRVLEGNRNSYALIVDKYKGPIFNLTYRMTGSYDDASDLAQETFIRAYKNLSRYNTEKKFFTWLYTISLNLIRNHLKGNKKETFYDSPENTDLSRAWQADTDDSEHALIKRQTIYQLNMCLRRLPGDHKEALVLRFYQDLSFEDVSEVLGISLSAAKMRVYRGLEKLQALMGDDQ